MNKESSVLALHNISKSYIQASYKIEILKNINLEVSAGELIAIIGDSGSGKSTLLHVAGLLDRPSSGSINICNLDCSKVNSDNYDHVRLNHVGFIYQDHRLLKDFTATENIAIPQIIAGKSLIEATQNANDLLNKINLSNRAKNLPGELSGGEQQRIAIARALINKPNIILADEPTGNLDPYTADNIFDIFVELSRLQNTAIIMVTHNHTLANKMDKIYELRYGSLARKCK